MYAEVSLHHSAMNFVHKLGVFCLLRTTLMWAQHDALCSLAGSVPHLPHRAMDFVC